MAQAFDVYESTYEDRMNVIKMSYDFVSTFDSLCFSDLLIPSSMHPFGCDLIDVHKRHRARWIMAIHVMARWHLAICFVIASAAPVTFKDDQLVKGRMEDAK